MDGVRAELLRNDQGGFGLLLAGLPSFPRDCTKGKQANILGDADLKLQRIHLIARAGGVVDL